MPQFIGTTTPLALSTTFTSQWVNVDTWQSVGGSVFADQAGTLYIEQSGDGVHADLSASTAVTASTGTSFSVTLSLPFVRARYVNGGSASTVMRLYPHFILGNGT